MEVKRYQFLLEAEQPIAHHSGSVGNMSLAMRRKTRLPDGRFAQVPIITADTMRHGLREAAAYAFLDAAGMLSRSAGISGGNLSRQALRLLFNGGMVSGRGDASSISLDRYREMCELCPPLALLGGCTDNRVVPGRIFVSDALMVCSESATFTPQWVTDAVDTSLSCRAHIEDVMRTRMDSLLDPAKRALLTDGEQVKALQAMGSSEAAHSADDALAKDEAKSSMLPRSMEVAIQGSLFSWEVTCNCLTEMDEHTLNVMLAAFLSSPVVGGKRATGHGRLRVVKAVGVEMQRPAQSIDAVNATALGASSAEVFRAHVAARKEQIAAWLSKVAA